MDQLSFRERLYFSLVALRGQALGAYYERFLREDRDGIPPDTTKKLLVQLLAHCRQSVPYYVAVMRAMGDSIHGDPEEYLKSLPILTKDTIRSRFDDLKSLDLPQRKWYPNTSGGSTGEPAVFIQDWEFDAKSAAITLLFSRLAGVRVGERVACLWGSEQDIANGSEGWKARLVHKIINTTFLNAFRMTPARMREFIAMLNTSPPKLIVAYAESLFALARFALGEGLEVVPQSVIITSAGTLYPFMRETIEQVFHCRVTDRYGSREVGDIACERPGHKGLWVAPWGNYVEIVDGAGHRVPDGTEGEILITSLTNYAMPLVRYRIGDRGVLSRERCGEQGMYGQVLERILGRTTDVFTTRDNTLVYPGFFRMLLYYKGWVREFQVVQRDLSSIVFRIVKSGADCQQGELDEISAQTKRVMGDDCEVTFEFLDEIPTSASGKYRHAISKVAAP